MKLDITDVRYAREVHDHALEAEAEACVTAGAVAAQVEIPPVVLGVKAELRHASGQHIEPFLTLRAADDLAYARNKAVGCGDGLAVVVQAHVKRLDLLGIIGDENWLLVDLFGQVALMLGLKINAPLDGVIKLFTAVFEDIDRLGVADTGKVV